MFSVADKKLSASRVSEGRNIRFRGTVINRQRRQTLWSRSPWSCRVWDSNVVTALAAVVVVLVVSRPNTWTRSNFDFLSVCSSSAVLLTSHTLSFSSHISIPRFREDGEIISSLYVCIPYAKTRFLRNLYVPSQCTSTRPIVIVHRTWQSLDIPVDVETHKDCRSRPFLSPFVLFFIWFSKNSD